MELFPLAKENSWQKENRWKCKPMPGMLQEPAHIVKTCPACGSTRLLAGRQFGMTRFKCRNCGFQHFE